jgi:toxin ParE1/3/4
MQLPIGWLSIIRPSRRCERRVRNVARWPESARRSATRANVRVTSLGRYPYKIFYRVADDTLEILHIHHAARQPWDERT